MIAIAQVTFGNNDDTHGRGSSKMAYRLYTVGLQALHRWLIIILALSRSRSLAYLFFGSRNGLGPAGGLVLGRAGHFKNGQKWREREELLWPERSRDLVVK